MASEVKKRVTIFINGKEVENSLKGMQAELARLRNQQRAATVGSKEWVDATLSIREVEGVIADQRAAMRGLTEEVEKGARAMQGSIEATIGSGKAALGLVQKITKGLGVPLGNYQEWVKSATGMTDAMALVQKTTGMTSEEVEELQERLKALDTRTGRAELNALASEAGKLGITGVEDVAQFVAAADRIGVALGDDLGEGAITTLGKLAGVYGQTTEELAEGAGSVGERMERIGSALNALGNASTANAGRMVDFMSRLGGVASSAGLSAEAVLGYASVIDQAGLSMASSATAMSKVITQVFKKPEEFARAAGMSVQEFTDLALNDMEEALRRLFSNLDAQGVDEITLQLKELGVDGGAATAVLNTLAHRMGDVAEAEAIAAEQLEAGTSVGAEFGSMNDTAAARMEKLQNRMEEVKTSLGERLLPLMERGTSVVIDATEWVTRNGTVMGALVGVIGGVAAAKGALAVQSAVATVKEKLHAAAVVQEQRAEAAANLTRQQAILARQQHLRVLLQERLARLQSVQTTAAEAQALTTANTLKRLEGAITEQQTRVTLAHAAAEKARAVAMASTPWGAVLAVAGALVGVVAQLVKKARESGSAMGELNAEIRKERSEADRLFEALRKTKEGTEEYKQALDALKEKYPDVIAKHVDEEGRLRDVEAAYKAVTQAIVQQTVARVKAQKIEEAEEDLQEDIKDGYDALYKMTEKVMKMKGNEGFDAAEVFAQFVRPQMDAIVDGTKTAMEAFNGMVEEATEAGVTGMGEIALMANGLFRKKGISWLRTLENDRKQLEKDLTRIDAEFAAVEKSAGGAVAAAGAGSGDGATTGGDGGDKTGGAGGGAQKPRVVAPTKEDIEKAEKAWETARETAERAMGRMERSALTGIDKTLAELDERGSEARKRLLSVTGEHRQEALKMVEEVNEAVERQKAEALAEWARRMGAEADKELEKQRAELAKKGLKAETEGSDGDDPRVKIRTALEQFEQAQREMDRTAEGWAERVKELAERGLTEEAAAMEARIEEYERLRAAMRETAATAAALQASKTVETVDTKKEERTLEADGEKDLPEWKKREAEQLRAINEEYERKQTLIAKAQARERLTLEMLREQKEQTTDPEVREAIEQRIGMHEEALQRLEEQAVMLDEVKEKETEAAQDEAMKQHWDEVAAAVEEYASKLTSILGSVNKIADNLGKRDLQRAKKEEEEKLALLQARLDRGAISQEQYEKEKAAAEEEYAEKEKQLNIESFERERAAKVFEATINGAVAVMKALADLGPIAGPIAAGVMAAMTAAQVAAILTEPAPYAEGGFVPRRQVFQAGERGEEWVASHQLLEDPETRPIIEGLERYQRAKGRAPLSVEGDGGGRVVMPRLGAVDSQAAMEAAERGAELQRRVSAPEMVEMMSGWTAQSERLERGLQELASTGREQAATAEAQRRLMKELKEYMTDPENRRAVISRTAQERFDAVEAGLRARARI